MVLQTMLIFHGMIQKYNSFVEEHENFQQIFALQIMYN